jgi:Domain of unknown function (DUF4145)
MKSRSEFAAEIASLDLGPADRAIAFLWFYRESQEYEERTASELATDMHEEGFPRANVTRLHDELRRSKYTVRGARNRSFQIAVGKLPELQHSYGELAAVTRVDVQDTVLPADWFAGTRPFLVRLAHQINGTYQFGFYDACATLCRRMMESLIIETYIHLRRAPEIRRDNAFFMLDALINKISHDTTLTLSRNSPATMTEVKNIGDTAAHDRNYITEQLDLADGFLLRYRRLIRELMGMAGIARAP